MPSLGADMEAGTIVEWRVRPGATVHRGDIVAVVETEKSTIEIEVFEEGTVEALLVEPGVEVPVGALLARITAPAAAPRPVPGPGPRPKRARKAAGRPAETKPRRAARPVPAVEVPAAPAARRFVRASPRARREAAARGVDLAALQGSGPGGAVLVRDVERAPVAAPAPAAPRKTGRREAVGALMARSKREIPHYYLATTVDLGPALAWLTDTNGRRPVTERILPAALLLKATALAAREVPVVNGTWEGGFRPAPAVHLGVAVSVRGGGLVAPALHDADRLDLDTLMRQLRDLVQRARAGVLRSSDVADPTLTVTNLGEQGVEEVFGVIYPPQVALVGFGRITERPWAADGIVEVRPVVRATLSADHRASDGHDGARFLAAVDRLLRTPEAL
jgi:pyruvate dehydrogenase E2 component (dihydrolipoamide acetyltransferase)